MSKIILDTEDFFQNDGYDDLMHIDHESYCCGEMFEKYETQIADLEAKLKALQNGIIDDETLSRLVREHKLYKDLEAKLAESEKSKESYRLQNDEHHLQLCQFYSRLGVEAFGADIHEKALETLMIMKDQLAEKEEIIESYKHTVYMNILNQEMLELKVATQDQDKISFAIEQLEKVKELCKEKFSLWKNSKWEGYCYDNIDVSNAIFDIQANIEEQIKAIKEMK